MIIYFVCLIIVVLALLYAEKIINIERLKINKSYLYWGICLILGLVSACRYNVGMDYQTYTRIYTDSSINVKEIGYQLINNISHFFGFSAQFTIACYSFVTIFLAFKFIQENSKKPFFSVLIFYAFSPFFLQSMNVIRQMLAIFIFAYSIKFIQNRDIKKYFFVIILGSLFAHQTILCTIPLYFILGREFDKKYMLLFSIIFLCSGPFVLMILKMTPYSYYLTLNASHNGFNIISLTFISEFLLSCFVYYMIRKEKLAIEYKNMSFLLMIFCIFLLINYNSIIGKLLERIMWYFLPVLLIAVPFVCEFNKKHEKIYMFLFCTFFILMFSMSIILKGTANQIVPYQLFFWKKI